MKTSLVNVNKLLCHECVHRAHVAVVRKMLQSDGRIRKPIVADRSTKIILDGHHRFQALCDLGAKRVPVAYVRYSDSSVRVYLRRKELLMKLVKRAVIEMAFARKVFPYKTTRHLITARPKMKAVRLAQLMK